MPHDMDGNVLEVGDRVRIAVRPMAIVRVRENPDYPDDDTPHIYTTPTRRSASPFSATSLQPKDGSA
jgi:hypothetical protein